MLWLGILTCCARLHVLCAKCRPQRVCSWSFTFSLWHFVARYVIFYVFVFMLMLIKTYSTWFKWTFIRSGHNHLLLFKLKNLSGKRTVPSKTRQFPLVALGGWDAYGYTPGRIFIPMVCFEYAAFRANLQVPNFFLCETRDQLAMQSQQNLRLFQTQSLKVLQETSFYLEIWCMIWTKIIDWIIDVLRF